MADLTFSEVVELFEDRYKATADDYRPLSELFLENKRGVTIWLDNGDLVLYCPKEINEEV